VARAATKRDRIIKFQGCYHGHADAFLVQAGSGALTFGTPDSPGVTAGASSDTLVASYNDLDSVHKVFDANRDRIAAVIVEPIAGNMGVVPPADGFLAGLRDACTASGALLIFDEVISGFRLGPGGAAAHYRIKPDLATFGKVIGGGMPVGAFAGKREIMKNLSPEGGVYQAGTLSGNPVAMTAGLATLRTLQKEDGWRRLEALGGYLDQVVGAALADSPVPVKLCRLGSMFWLAWLANVAPRSAEALEPRAAAVYARVFHALLDQGIALAPSAFEIAFLSLAHSKRDVDRLAEGLRAALTVAATPAQ